MVLRDCLGEGHFSQAEQTSQGGRVPLNHSGATNPSIHKRTVINTAQQAANDGANGSGSVCDELQQEREEQTKFREDIKKMGHCRVI